MKKMRKETVYLVAWVMTIVMEGACTRSEEPIYSDTRTQEIKGDEPESGISFRMESDSLEEDVEEVWFEAKGWEGEGMGVDL